MARKRFIDWKKVPTGKLPLHFNFVYYTEGSHIQCCYCGKFILIKHITKDHVYPKSKGGLIKAPACNNCNMDKEDMLPIDWAIYASKHGRDLAVIPFGEIIE